MLLKKKPLALLSTVLNKNINNSISFLLNSAIKLGETRPISVVTAPTGKPDLPCRVLAKGPTGPYQELPTKKVPGGYQCLYSPKEPGNNSVKVEFAGKEVPNSPYHVNVQSDVDVTKVQIKGLESRKLAKKEPLHLFL